MEHAKVNLKHAIMFNPNAIKLCEKIYLLVRDYTLFHFIYERKYENIVKIFRNNKEGIDLTKEIALSGRKTALNELLELEQKKTDARLGSFPIRKINYINHFKRRAN